MRLLRQRKEQLRKYGKNRKGVVAWHRFTVPQVSNERHSREHDKRITGLKMSTRPDSAALNG